MIYYLKELISMSLSEKLKNEYPISNFKKTPPPNDPKEAPKKAPSVVSQKPEPAKTNSDTFQEEEPEK